MSTNYAHQHAAGFTSEGSVTQDKLFERNTRRRKGTILSGQGVLVRGTLLGKITASGKWVKSLSASSDGSQDPRGILLHDVDATSADAEAIIARAGDFAIAGITFGTGHTAASVDDALIDRGIFLETIVG